jgi:hypothetical protein
VGGFLSFLGGSAFRAILGEVGGWLTKRQDHKYEMQRMELQGKLDAAQHDRNLAAQRLQAELGYKTIAVQAEAEVSKLEGDAWRLAVAQSQQPTGIRWIDALNAAVRPVYGYYVLALWALYEHRNDWALTAFSLEIIAAVIGFFFADRTLRKAGK